MFQKLGAQNGFDVEIWDPNINQCPGRQAPAGVSVATSPFLDLATLMQSVVFDSTVGRDAAGLTAVEFANLQAYIRAGGGFVAIHGATDSMQNVPWYMDLVGAGFTNHGGNAGGILIDTDSGGHVELYPADPSHPATSGISEPFLGHSWQYMTEPWYQNMMLKAVEWTAGKAYANCVTYVEVAELLAASAASGDVTSGGNAVLGALLQKARADFDQGSYQKAVVTLERCFAGSGCGSPGGYE